MTKDSFIIYTSFYKPISLLSDKQLGRLFRAIFSYNLGEIVNVEDDIRMAFEFFKNQFDIDESKYQAKINRDIENGRRGGNPNLRKGQPNPYYKSKREETGKGNITQDNPPLSDITQDNLNDNVNDNDIKRNNIKEKFEEFRKYYPGNKRGLDTEFSNFVKKHKDYSEVIDLLLPSIVKETEWHNRKRAAGQFTPEYAHLQTWINQRRWENELENISSNENEQQIRSKQVYIVPD